MKPGEKPLHYDPSKDDERKSTALTTLFTHYWSALETEKAKTLQITDYLNDLENFEPEVVEKACSDWRRDKNNLNRRPTPAGLIDLCRQNLATNTGERPIWMWRIWMNGWYEKGFWSENIVGPPPGAAGCKVPRELLQDHARIAKKGWWPIPNAEVVRENYWDIPGPYLTAAERELAKPRIAKCVEEINKNLAVFSAKVAPKPSNPAREIF